MERNEFNSKVSSKMSEYLLSGYRMLADICEKCNGVMFMDKNQRNFCVACELENSNNSKKCIPVESNLTNSICSGDNNTCSNNSIKSEVLQPSKDKLIKKLVWAIDNLNSANDSCVIKEWCHLIDMLMNTIKELSLLITH